MCRSCGSSDVGDDDTGRKSWRMLAPAHILLLYLQYDKLDTRVDLMHISSDFDLFSVSCTWLGLNRRRWLYSQHWLLPVIVSSFVSTQCCLSWFTASCLILAGLSFTSPFVLFFLSLFRLLQSVSLNQTSIFLDLIQRYSCCMSLFMFPHIHSRLPLCHVFISGC